MSGIVEGEADDDAGAVCCAIDGVGIAFLPRRALFFCSVLLYSTRCARAPPYWPSYPNDTRQTLPLLLGIRQQASLYRVHRDYTRGDLKRSTTP